MASVICRKFGFVFIHIPKNAGTTITRILEKTCGPVLIEESDNMQRVKSTAHSTYLQMKENFHESWNDFYKFCVVRNPWDRFVSLYNHVLHYYKISPHLLRFDDFVFCHLDPLESSLGKTLKSDDETHDDCHCCDIDHIVLNTKGSSALNRIRNIHDGTSQFKFTQWEYMVDENDTLRGIDHFIRFENLKEELQSLGIDEEHFLHEVFTIDAQRDNENGLIHAKDSHIEDYRKYYTGKTRVRVEDICKRDIELFGYEYD